MRYILSFVREYLHILYASIAAISCIETILSNCGIVSFSGAYDFHVLMLIFLVIGFVFGSAYIFFEYRYSYETFHAYSILNLCTCFLLILMMIVQMSNCKKNISEFNQFAKEYVEKYDKDAIYEAYFDIQVIESMYEDMREVLKQNSKETNNIIIEHLRKETELCL